MNARHPLSASMPLLRLVVPRAVHAFVWWWHGVSFSRKRGCAVAIGVALSCLFDRVAVVVARGGGVLWRVIM